MTRPDRYARARAAEQILRARCEEAGLICVEPTALPIYRPDGSIAFAPLLAVTAADIDEQLRVEAEAERDVEVVDPLDVLRREGLL